MFEEVIAAYKFIEDGFTKRRRKQFGKPFLAVITCAKCGSEILLYQKDGKGRLLRMYLDRIVSPAELAKKYRSCTTKADVPSLKCEHCMSVIAAPMVYQPEKRLALRTINGAFSVTKVRES
jgi:hypothetical protein